MRHIGLSMRPIDRSCDAFISPPCRVSFNGFRNNVSYPLRGQGILSVVGTLRCVLRLFTSKGRDATEQLPSPLELQVSNLYDIINTSDNIQSLRSGYKKFRHANSDFERNLERYLRDLFFRIKADGSMTVNKIAMLRDMLMNIDNKISEKVIHECLTTCSNKAEADIMLLLYDVIIGSKSNSDIPPIASLHQIYKKEKIDPGSAILAYKDEMYKREIELFLIQQMEERAKTNPPVPPPIAGEMTELEQRKSQLVESLGEEMAPMLRRADSNIDVASRTMLKPAWQLQFYSDMKNIEPPMLGRQLLGLEEQKCQKLYREVIQERCEKIREKVLSSDGMDTKNNFQEVPKLALIAHSRKCQIAHTCINVTDWERIEKDRVGRLKERYDIDLREASDHVIPLRRKSIGGGKPLPQPFYVNPDDDPNYDPPGSTASSRLMKKLMRGDNDGDDKYTLTDAETCKRSLAIVAKDMEPFEHLTPEKLSDMVFRNCRKEYELAEAVCRRRSRGRNIEDDEERSDIPSIGRITPRVDDATSETTYPRQEAEVSSQLGTNQKLRKDYVVSREELLTDTVVFLSTLEHLQWQFACSIELPMETLYYTHQIGTSVTNPRFPLLKFYGWRFQEASGFCNEYLASVEDANRYRQILKFSAMESDIDKTVETVDKLLLFGDDPIFYLKDQEMLKHMVGTGIGLEIHSKVPGFTLPPDPSEHQKSTIFYRMSNSQPHPQLRCSICGYTIFSHAVRAHDGESLISIEHEASKGKPTQLCPVCNHPESILKVEWTTGSRAYTEEPYPTPMEDEYADD